MAAYTVPVTLPAHAAAVLPFFRLSRRGVLPTALVVGACAPDLSYLYAVRRLGDYAHEFPGFILFCVPVGLAVLVWLEALILPALRLALPEVAGVQWGRFARTEGLPRTPLAWWATVAALVLGATTHLLWDGFTHHGMWPADVLYPDVRVPVGSRELPLARVLQHTSSLVGSLVVLGYMARRYRYLEPVPGGSWADCLRVLLPMAVGALLGLALRLSRFQDMGALEAQVWWAFWPTVTGALAGLTVGCVLVRWRRPS
ncbi:DUF4184 family protein [Archangium lansingense]|uniref:DUF4184 family protein n=1 Tax=Archangium lansingense TaxID=2995310 RepID=A0ABT3ZW98_9BACT|nr:DUF4184 family protein [Archangium lansinium]MCY1073371.1 DUF4184 family protein [Archangium lansinium]